MIKYFLFFKTASMRNKRLFYSIEYDDVQEALKKREELILNKVYNDEKIIYTSIKEYKE